MGHSVTRATRARVPPFGGARRLPPAASPTALAAVADPTESPTATQDLPTATPEPQNAPPAATEPPLQVPPTATPVPPTPLPPTIGPPATPTPQSCSLTMTISPSLLDFGVSQSSLPLTIRAEGCELDVEFTLTPTESWIVPAQMNGTVPANGEVVNEVGVNRSILRQSGVYEGQLIVGSIVGQLAVQVEMVVSGPSDITRPPNP